MKIKFTLAISTLVLLNSCGMSSQSKFGFPNCSEKKLSIQKVINNSKKGVVVISTDKSTGSGFVVGHKNNQTFILTNSHVLDGKNKVLINWFDGNEDIGIVEMDEGGNQYSKDLALILVKGKEGLALPLIISYNLLILAISCCPIILCFCCFFCIF